MGLQTNKSLVPIFGFIFILSVAGIFFMVQKNPEVLKSDFLPSFIKKLSPAPNKACTKPIDGGWSQWGYCYCEGDPTKSSQGTCTMTRACTNPEPSCGGKDCIGDNKRVQDCSLGVGYCGDGKCNIPPENPPETCMTCKKDCGKCHICGDKVCSGLEDCSSCPIDCGECPYCGDHICDDKESEDCYTCAEDCGKCPLFCGNGICQENENCMNCESDCGHCCGNGKCDYSFGENCSHCFIDCGTCPVCGDGKCDDQPGYRENCISCKEDCGACCGNGKCEPQFGEQCVSSKKFDENACEDCGACCGETCESMDYPCESKQIICGERITCPECCKDTCFSLGYTCGTFDICGYSIQCGDPQCHCTDACAKGSSLKSAETLCINDSLYTCGENQDNDLCNDWIVPGTACSEGCIDGQKQCTCTNECDIKGSSWCETIDNVDLLFSCGEKEDGDDCFEILDPLPCKDQCIETEKGAMCSCLDECTKGEKKCVVDEIKDANENLIQRKYTLYDCGESYDFDSCLDLINPRVCRYGCNEDLTDCAEPCKNECQENQTICLPYDSNKDGMIDSQDENAVYTCGYSDDLDICREWTNPKPCIQKDGICRRRDNSCLCNNCTLSDQKCVPFETWSFSGSQIMNKLAICQYNETLDCHQWVPIKDCDFGCLEGSSHCNDCRPNCQEEGQTRCEMVDQKYTRQICEKSSNGCLQWTNLKECEFGCEYNSDGYFTHTTGYCNSCEDACIINTTRCSKGRLYMCQAHNHCPEWKYIEDCPQGCDPDNSACQCEDDCQGSVWCNNNQLKQCINIDMPPYVGSKDSCKEKSDRLITTCANGCDAENHQCSLNCIDTCLEGGTICKSSIQKEKNKTVFKSFVYSCELSLENTGNKDCYTLKNPVECPFGCNKDQKQCASCANPCDNLQEAKCMHDRMYICTQTNDSCKQWTVDYSNTCNYGCSEKNDACYSGYHQCDEEGSSFCDLKNDTLYKCIADKKGNKKWTFEKTCEWGCAPEPCLLGKCFKSEQCDSCPYDCQHPGPDYPEGTKFTCGIHSICDNPQYNCGPCPKDCRFDIDSFNVHHNKNECSFIWDGKLIQTTASQECELETGQVSIDEYTYQQGVFQNSSQGDIYHEICRIPNI